MTFAYTIGRIGRTGFASLRDAAHQARRNAAQYEIYEWSESDGTAPVRLVACYRFDPHPRGGLFVPNLRYCLTHNQVDHGHHYERATHDRVNDLVCQWKQLFTHPNISILPDTEVIR